MAAHPDSSSSRGKRASRLILCLLPALPVLAAGVFIQSKEAPEERRAFASPPATPPPEPPSEESVTLVAVGDICLAGGVGRAMQEKGRGYPFARLKGYLRQADIAFGNLECVIALGGRPIPKRYNFRAHPRSAMALQEAGFDVLSLANNHTFDFGKEALAETIGHLRERGIAPVGAGNTLQEARRLRVVEAKGLRIGFLAYLGLFPSLLPLRAQEPAIAMADAASMRADVRAARKRVDFLIVSLHAGVERMRRRSRRQEAMARAAVDSGADMVIGHHPHVVQDTEVYRGKPIFYSLGNFVFDPSPSFLREGGRGWSALVQAKLTRGRLPEARLIDLRIVANQPEFESTLRKSRVMANQGRRHQARREAAPEERSQ